MNIAGIVAEYDPLHTGHAWQIQQAKQMGAQAVVCVISPSVVQRGGVSIFPVWVRVQAALLAGADLVLCLPAPYAASSAEQFGAAAVSILGALGNVDSLVFGSESGQAQALMETAALLRSEGFADVLKNELNKGDSFAAARARAMQMFSPETAQYLQTPNDILGIEYCKALQNQKLSIQPVAIKRQGAGHGGKPAGGFASASWLRLQTAEKGVAGWQEYTPECCKKLYLQAEQEGLLPDRKAVEIAFLSRLRMMRKEQLQQVRGVSEGLENKLLNAVKHSQTLDQLYDNMKSKRYAHARIRRLVLDAVLSVPGTLPDLPPYIHILGASAAGIQLLKAAQPSLPCASSLASLEKTGREAALVAQLHADAENLSMLCRTTVQPMGTAYTKPMVIREKLL